jgi:hypothetical protein
LIETEELNEVTPERGVTAVIVPLVATDPAFAVFEVGNTIFTIAAVLLVKISGIVPTLQLTLTAVVVLVTELGVTVHAGPVVGITLQGQLVQVTSSEIAVAVPVANVPLGIFSATLIVAP